MTKRQPYAYRDAFELPVTVTTLSGVIFDPRAAKWQYVDQGYRFALDFAQLEGVPDAFIYGLKRTLIWYAEHGSPFSVKNFGKRGIRYFAKLAKQKAGFPTAITSVHLRLEKSRCFKATGNDNLFSHLVYAFKKWADLSLPGISANAEKWLLNVKLKIPPSGTAITTLDPENGPFSDIERESLLDALSAAYEHSMIDQRSYVLVWLFALFGARSQQFSVMKTCDFKVIQGPDGERFEIHLPLAKGIASLWRTEFFEADLVPDLGELFRDYTQQVQQSLIGKIDELNHAPMFPSHNYAELCPGFEYHRTSASIAEVLMETIKKLGVLSERTGRAFHANARRFRYTVGTNSIREGLGPDATAKRLGHRWPSSVKPYIQLSKLFELHDRINLGVAAELGALGQLFKGKIDVGDEHEALDPHRQIFNPAIDPSMKERMGRCGKDSYCNFNKPIACYTCLLFRAWLDGPHEAVFAHLTTYRDKQIKAKVASSIIRIHDRTIAAVAQVIVLCNNEKERRSQFDEGVAP